MDGEDALLADNGIRMYTSSKLGLIPLETADSVEPNDVKRIEGFSLTDVDSATIEDRVGISDIGERLQAGLECTYWDRVSGTAQILEDGTVIGPFMRPL